MQNPLWNHCGHVAPVVEDENCCVKTRVTGGHAHCLATRLRLRKGLKYGVWPRHTLFIFFLQTQISVLTVNESSLPC